MKQDSKNPLLEFAKRKLLFGAIFVNFFINLVAGWAIYGGYDLIPWEGSASVVADTFVGAVLISFFTFFVTAPVVQAEARAGRLPGRGREGFFAWIQAHKVWSSILFAVVVGGFFGTLALKLLEPTYAKGMPPTAFLAFKGIFSSIIGVIAAYLALFVAIQGGEPPREDPRWCKDPEAPVDGVVYPCDYIDKGGIGVTHEEHGCSGTPTWQLVVRGALDPKDVKTALGDLVTRYPSLTTVIQSLDGYPEYATRFRYATNPEFTVDSMFEVVDLREQPEEALQELLHEVLNRHTDQFREPSVTLTMAILNDDRVRLLFRQHHGLADGRAFIELLTDFGNYLAAACRNQRPSEEELEPIGRKPELEAFGVDEKERGLLRLGGLIWFVRSRVQHFFSPPTPLKQNDSTDYRGGNATLHWVISDETLEPWRSARKEMGVSLNSMLAGALFEANRRWHKELGRPLGKTSAMMVMETRPRDGSFRSFANHLATLEAHVDLGSDIELADISRSIHSQVKGQIERRQPLKRHLIERALVEPLSMDKLHNHVFAAGGIAGNNIDFSNLIPLHFPTLEGPEWKVDEVLITTPITPRNGIVFTVIRYNGKLIFNVNYKESAATSEEASALLGHFTGVLEEATEHVPEELPTEAFVLEPLPVELEPLPETKSVFDFGWRDKLLRPGLSWKLALLAMLLASPSLFNGIVLDDQLQHLKVDGRKSPHYSASRPMDLFHFISKDNHKAMIESGAYPWWAAPKLQLSFFRPLSSLTHWVEYKYFSKYPKWMHFHSLLWLALLVILLAAMYRRYFASAWIAALASLLYAVDEARGLAVGFLANRNALIATCFAVLVLMAHDRWRKEGWKPGAILGPVLLALGLLSAEFALFATAYLFAYALFLDKDKSWKRWLTLVPYGVVVVAWRLWYKALGYGAIQSGAYIDPLGDPLRFFGAVLERLPTLLLAQWTFISADFWMTNTDLYNALHALMGAILLGVIAMVLTPVLRDRPLARFWAVGMFLSALPSCATFPHDRLLLGVGIGAMGLIAQFMAYRFGEPVEGEPLQKPSQAFPTSVRFFAGFFLIVHVYLAPFFLPIKTVSPYFLGVLETRAYNSMPRLPNIGKKSIYLIQSPGFLGHTIFAVYALNDRPQPKVLRQLSISLKKLKLERTGDKSLILTADDALVDRSTQYLSRSTALPFKVGQVFRTPDVTVTVKKLGEDGRPSVAEFRFRKSLDHPDHIWMIWRGKKFVPFKMPAVGKTLKLPRLSTTSMFL